MRFYTRCNFNATNSNLTGLLVGSEEAIYQYTCHLLPKSWQVWKFWFFVVAARNAACVSGSLPANLFWSNYFDRLALNCSRRSSCSDERCVSVSRLLAPLLRVPSCLWKRQIDNIREALQLGIPARKQKQKQHCAG